MTRSDISDKAAFVRQALDQLAAIPQDSLDRIDPAIVYRVLTEDRADLAELLERLLAAADEQ